MSKLKFRLNDYVAHIVDAISSIEDYTSEGRDTFMKSKLHQDAVIRNLEIVGEASGKIISDHSDF